MDAVKIAYRQALQSVVMSGPTTMAPAILKAIEITKAYAKQGTKQQLIVIILTDGDISDEVKDTQAVCMASNFPISICAIGLGDGPFDKLEALDDLKRGRRFDNFHFTDFTDFLRKAQRSENPELDFATDVFTEIGAQYKMMKKLGIL